MTSGNGDPSMRPLPPARPGRVGVVLVNWNGWQDTIEAYESVRASTHGDWVVIAVDNASTDESAERLRNIGERFHLVQNPTNAGFAGACNVAVEKARTLGADYVFFLNNDALVTSTTIERLLEASRALGDRAVLGSVVRYDETGELQFYGSHESEMWGAPRWLPPVEASFEEAPDLIESDFIFGAALFSPMPLIAQTGAFDERFFLNYEETDWCYRARRAGIPCFVVKAALTHHKGSASLGPLAGPMQTYFLVRNELLFTETHASTLQLMRVYKKALKHSLLRLQDAVKRRRGLSVKLDTSSRAYFLAIRDYLFRRFGDCPPRVRQLAKEFRAELARNSGHA